MTNQRSSRRFRDIRPPLDGLASSLHRIEGQQKRSEIRGDLPAGGNWRRCADVLDGPSHFRSWQEQLGDWLRERRGEAPARTVAGYIMSWYLHVPAYVGALLLHHERRVPSLRPDELAFRLCEDRPHPKGMAALGDAFHCLPSDPGSGRPEATVVADERALAATLRAHYIAHAAQFVRAYTPVSGFGPRMLWAAATDALDNSLWWAGRQGGTAEAEGAGVADAALVLESRFEPLTSASTLRISQAGGRGWTRRRESCCFSYLLAGEPACEGCPRTSPKP
jgi:hypothetical protein